MPKRYSAEMKTRAFSVWLYEADRKPLRTATILLHESNRGAEKADVPDESTIRYWVESEDWHLKAQEELAKRSEAWRHRQYGRLLLSFDRGLDEYDAIMRGERDHLPAAAINARVQLIKLGIEATGTGAMGAKYEAPPIPLPPVLVEALSKMTPEELTEITHRKLNPLPEGEKP